MDARTVTRRSLWLALAAGVVAAILLAPRWLGPYTVRSVLRMAGASEIEFAAVRGSPWHLEIEDLRFQVRTQPFFARRVVLDRPRWWMASLGAVRIEGADVPVFLDGSDVNPWHWRTYGEAADPSEAVNLPLQTLELAGRLTVRVATAPDMPVQLEVRGWPRGAGNSWDGTLVARAPGFRLEGSGSLLRAAQELEFKVETAHLDLAIWSRQVQRLVALPGAPWEIAGRLEGAAEGRVTARRFAATARVTLRDGRVRVPAREVVATGVEADLEFSDLWKYRTKAGELRVGDLAVGRIDVKNFRTDFGLWGASTVIFGEGRGELFGGVVRVAPLRYYREQREAVLNLHVEGVDASRLLALAPEITTPIAGRVQGDLAVRLQTHGVRIDEGMMQLDNHSGARLLLNPGALLRSGARVDERSLQVLKGLGAAPTPMTVSRLALDIRADDLPLGTSGRVSLAGDVGGTSIAAVLDVPGAIEGYIEVQP